MDMCLLLFTGPIAMLHTDDSQDGYMVDSENMTGTLFLHVL
jgi:hypothetical protein